MRSQPLIVCRDVKASSRFYERLLGCRNVHGGSEYARLVDPRLHHSEWGSDGMILQLHAADADHHHGALVAPSASRGNGVMLWFEVDDFDAAVGRARKLGARVLRDVHENPNARHRELWLEDLDGYVVVLASPDGETQRAPQAPVPLMRFPSARKRDREIDAWIRSRDATLRPLAKAWFARLRACGPDVRELMHDGQATACVGDAAFAYVAVYAEHVNVGFFLGALLDDPAGLLTGTGKRGRHVKLLKARPIDDGALSRLIKAAYADIKSRIRD